MNGAFIIGCGGLGLALGAALRARGIPVRGLRRNAAEQLRAAGIEPVIADLDQPLPPDTLAVGGGTVFYFAPPPTQGEEDPRMARVLEALAEAPPSKLIYLSTSGVYGDCQGAWVDETAEVRPSTARARRRLNAEQRLLDWAGTTGTTGVVLRVGGIYGPGRLPVKRIREGLTLVCPEEAPYSNRIHIHDLVRACLAGAARGESGAHYNVADGQPTTMTDYFYQVADHFGLPRPPCVPLSQAREALSPAMLSYVSESRRLVTRRMREELGIVPDFPDLPSGLAASAPPS